MNRNSLIKKMLNLRWAFHILVDSTLVLGYYVYVHPPSATTSLINMLIEFPIVLGVADIITHYALNYD